MSGGKYTSESAMFIPAIGAAVFGALIKSGTEAVVEAGKAVEMQKILSQSKKQYTQYLHAQQDQTRKALEEYNQRLWQEVHRLEQELIAKGLTLPASAATAPQRLQQLNELLRRHDSVRAAIETKTYFISLLDLEQAGKVAEQLCQTADVLIAEKTRYSAQAAALKEQALALLRQSCTDTARYQALYDSLSQLLVLSQKSAAQRDSLRDEYNNELARARALCHITNTAVLYPVFSEETAPQAILRLKELCTRQMQLIEEIRKNPALNMSPEDRQKSCEAVADRICAALVGRGVKLRQVSLLNSCRICYYYYRDALLKVTVTDTGIVTFEVVGDPKKRTGFTNRDKQRVVAAMEQFQTEYPHLQESLSHNGVKLNLHDCVEPSEDIVTYEVPELLTDEERAENDAAILTMLQAAQRVHYVDGGGA